MDQRDRHSTDPHLHLHRGTAHVGAGHVGQQPVYHNPSLNGWQRAPYGVWPGPHADHYPPLDTTSGKWKATNHHAQHHGSWGTSVPSSESPYHRPTKLDPSHTVDRKRLQEMDEETRKNDMQTTGDSETSSRCDDNSLTVEDDLDDLRRLDESLSETRVTGPIYQRPQALEAAFEDSLENDTMIRCCSKYLHDPQDPTYSMDVRETPYWDFVRDDPMFALISLTDPGIPIRGLQSRIRELVQGNNGWNDYYCEYDRVREQVLNNDDHDQDQDQDQASLAMTISGDECESASAGGDQEVKQDERDDKKEAPPPRPPSSSHPPSDSMRDMIGVAQEIQENAGVERPLSPGEIDQSQVLRAAERLVTLGAEATETSSIDRARNSARPRQRTRGHAKKNPDRGAGRGTEADTGVETRGRDGSMGRGRDQHGHHHHHQNQNQNHHRHRGRVRGDHHVGDDNGKRNGNDNKSSVMGPGLRQQQQPRQQQLRQQQQQQQPSTTVTRRSRGSLRPDPKPSRKRSYAEETEQQRPAPAGPRKKRARQA